MQCYACKEHKFLLSKGSPIGSPLLFVRGATRVKSLSFAEKWSIDQEPLAFCMRCYACKNSIFLLSKEPSIESPLLFICGATHVKNISFCCLDWRVPLTYVTELDVPNLERDRLSV
jgi:hypothetical protein